MTRDSAAEVGTHIGQVSYPLRARYLRSACRLPQTGNGSSLDTRLLDGFEGREGGVIEMDQANRELGVSRTQQLALNQCEGRHHDE